MPEPKVEITEVYFERVFNLGNYETFRIGLRATVAPGQDVVKVIKALDKETVRARQEDVSK